MLRAEPSVLWMGACGMGWDGNGIASLVGWTLSSAVPCLLLATPGHVLDDGLHLKGCGCLRWHHQCASKAIRRTAPQPPPPEAQKATDKQRVQRCGRWLGGHLGRPSGSTAYNDRLLQWDRTVYSAHPTPDMAWLPGWLGRFRARPSSSPLQSPDLTSQDRTVLQPPSRLGDRNLHKVISHFHLLGIVAPRIMGICCFAL
jgi:hypothetical protein